VYQPISAKDVDVTVRFKPVGGTVDQAGGIAIRLTTPGDYYVVRANALEDNVNFYRVAKGRRSQIKGVDAKVATGQWHTLGLHAEGDPLHGVVRRCAVVYRRGQDFCECRQGGAVDQGRQRDVFRRDLDHPAGLIEGGK